MVIAGRGYGKTRCGAEAVIEEARDLGAEFRGALVGRTAADVRDVIVEGESGILARSPPDFRPLYEPSKRRLTWPNGAVASTYSADEPDVLRGPQHSLAWCDELAAWPYRDTWDQLRFGMRLGQHPRIIVTTTPRPKAIVRELISDPRTHVTRGSTYDNAQNLAPDFLSVLRRKYEGTTLGRQEIFAEILDETPGALWVRALIDKHRTRAAPEPLLRVVVAVDPATTADEDSDETGIIVAAAARPNEFADVHGYVLADYSGRYTPEQWGQRAVWAYHHHRADRIVTETNQGGLMCEAIVRNVDRSVAYRGVHASRGKVARAEPVAALAEQGRIHHVGTLVELEDQLVTWTPGMPSPDRLDAFVWALTDLLLEHAPAPTRIDLDIGTGGNPWEMG